MVPTVRELRRLRDTGEVTPQHLRLRLEPADLELIDQTPSLTIWYPVEVQDRLNLMIREVRGGRDEDLTAFSRETASDVLSVKAMQFLLLGVRRLRVQLGPNLVRMAHFAFSFGHWQFVGDDLLDFRVVGRELDAMPDTFRHSIQGFIEHLATDLAGEAVNCQSSRDNWSEIEFVCRGTAARVTQAVTPAPSAKP